MKTPKKIDFVLYDVTARVQPGEPLDLPAVPALFTDGRCEVYRSEHAVWTEPDPVPGWVVLRMYVVAPLRKGAARDAIAAALGKLGRPVFSAGLVYDVPDVGCDFETPVYCSRRPVGCTRIVHKGPCAVTL